VRISCLVVYILMTSAFARAGNVGDYFSRMRETSLAWLVGRFKVIGSEPASGKTYEGFVVVSRQGDRLFIKKTINGKVTTGRGTIRFEPETPVLEVAFNGKEPRESADIFILWTLQGTSFQAPAQLWKLGSLIKLPLRLREIRLSGSEVGATQSRPYPRSQKAQ
jgi:hypothetical protein